MTFSILETMILGWNMTILQLYSDNFSTLYVILSGIAGICILLNLNFYQNQGNIMMVLSQVTIIMLSMRLMIIITIIRLTLFFLYFITNDMYNGGNCKMHGNLLCEILNYVVSMDNIICGHRILINHLTLTNVHFYFYMYTNENQILDYANDNLSLDLQRLCFNTYNIANITWIIIYNCKFLYLYIVLYVIYGQLNVCTCSMIIIITIIIAIVFVVYSKIDKFKGNNIFDILNTYHCEIYIFCNVLCKNSNYIFYFTRCSKKESERFNIFNAIYFGIVTPSTVGFGDKTPVSGNNGEIFTLCWAIVGVVLSATLAGAISNFLLTKLFHLCSTKIKVYHSCFAKLCCDCHLCEFVSTTQDEEWQLTKEIIANIKQNGAIDLPTFFAMEY